MSLAIVTQIRAKYPTPLGARHAAFLTEVARNLGMGLLAKNFGVFIAYPCPGGGVSQDHVMTRNGDSWDILEDGEGLAKPVFNVSNVQDIGRYVVPEQSVGPVDPPVTVTPEVPPADPDLDLAETLTTLIAGIDAILAQLDTLDKPLPAYEGRFLGAKITLRPVE